MKIICYGDSNTFGYDPRGFFGGRYDHPWPEILAGKMGCTVINRGENGREIPAGAVNFQDADLLIVMLGTNDLLQGASVEEVRGRMERFLRRQDRTRILLVAPPVMKPGTWITGGNLIGDSVALGICLESLAQRLGIRFANAGQWDLPLAFDGVHLTEAGHEILAERLYQHLMNL